MKEFQIVKLLQLAVIVFIFFSFSNLSMAQDDDSAGLPPITVVGIPWNPSPNIPVPDFTGLPGGSGGSGGGGGDGNQQPQVGIVLPRQPGADDSINCNSPGELRRPYAGSNVNYNRGITGTPGNLLNGLPRPGQQFTVVYGNGQRESYTAGPYGSPTVAANLPISGTCH